MYLWVMYDVSDNRNRRRIAKACRLAGLERVQRSVFLGKIYNSAGRALATELQPLIDPTRDKLYLTRIDKGSYRRIRRYGVDFAHAAIDAVYTHRFF